MGLEHQQDQLRRPQRIPTTRLSTISRIYTLITESRECIVCYTLNKEKENSKARNRRIYGFIKPQELYLVTSPIFSFYTLFDKKLGFVSYGYEGNERVRGLPPSRLLFYLHLHLTPFFFHSFFGQRFSHLGLF